MGFFVDNQIRVSRVFFIFKVSYFFEDSAFDWKKEEMCIGTECSHMMCIFVKVHLALDTSSQHVESCREKIIHTQSNMRPNLTSHLMQPLGTTWKQKSVVFHRRSEQGVSLENRKLMTIAFLTSFLYFRFVIDRVFKKSGYNKKLHHQNIIQLLKTFQCSMESKDKQFKQVFTILELYGIYFQ